MPSHIPTARETDCHLVERINGDGTCIVLDKYTGQLTTVRLGLYSITGGYWTLWDAWLRWLS
jgi:hypothetical protein